MNEEQHTNTPAEEPLESSIPVTNNIKIDPAEAIKYGWEMFKANKVFFVGISIFIFAVFAVLSLTQGILSELVGEKSVGGVLIAIVFQLIWFMFTIGMLTFFLKIYDKKPWSLKDFMPNKPTLILSFIVASITAGIGTMLGFVLLIVPGVIISLGISQFGFVLIDENAGPFEALARSWEITKGSKGQLFLFMIYTGLVALGGFLALIIGTAVAFPVISLAQAHVYRKLNPLQSNTEPEPIVIE